MTDVITINQHHIYQNEDVRHTIIDHTSLIYHQIVSMEGGHTMIAVDITTKEIEIEVIGVLIKKVTLGDHMDVHMMVIVIIVIITITTTTIYHLKLKIQKIGEYMGEAMEQEDKVTTTKMNNNLIIGVLINLLIVFTLINTTIMVNYLQINNLLVHIASHICL